ERTVSEPRTTYPVNTPPFGLVAHTAPGRFNCQWASAALQIRCTGTSVRRDEAAFRKTPPVALVLSCRCSAPDCSGRIMNPTVKTRRASRPAEQALLTVIEFEASPSTQ